MMSLSFCCSYSEARRRLLWLFPLWAGGGGVTLLLVLVICVVLYLLRGRRP